MGYEIYKKTVGIVGLGNIGKRTATLLKAFGANIVYYDINKNTDKFKKVSLEKLLETSDIVSIHIPYTKENENMFNYENLSKMKKNAILINCARSKVIDQKDLVKILDENKIMACALDVFDIEPPLPKNHIILNRKNAYLSAYIAYLTNESMIRRFKICTDNVIEFIKKGKI
ncbi:2-hydroxyacid dehydrogenase [Caviibacter abscessus]|uniref:2-hydroxyacid dehydrogenase n=1 Tax=Caviibacter abscessus TaxID=1766719 RepID=UPI0012E3C983|nr:NAD(P)-dependent oxidoreductase [Caviibacter abscessus]